MTANPTHRTKGFTLIEILIVVMVIGILVAIAVGAYSKTKEGARKWACIANMKSIDAAKMEWALENNKSSLDTPTEDDVLPYLQNDEMPVCPSGGDSYAMNTVAERTVCPNVGDFPDHAQP